VLLEGRGGLVPMNDLDLLSDKNLSQDIQVDVDKTSH